MHSSYVYVYFNERLTHGTSQDWIAMRPAQFFVLQHANAQMPNGSNGQMVKTAQFFVL